MIGILYSWCFDRFIENIELPGSFKIGVLHLFLEKYITNLQKGGKRDHQSVKKEKNLFLPPGRKVTAI